jgi:plastocyanin
MRSRRRWLDLLAAAAFASIAAVAAATGGQASVTPSHHPVLRTAGREIFKVNHSDTSTLHFLPQDVTVRQGDTLTLVHGDGTHDPHTVSIVAAGELPTGGECAACEKVQKAQFPHGPQGPPQPVVNVGRPGLDAPGDSVLWIGGQMRVKVTAAPGTILHYFCAVHPWMQGTIHVIR